MKAMNVFENSLEMFEKYKPTPLLRLKTRGECLLPSWSSLTPSAGA
ncbi:hypothetical protein [Thermococcus sp.]|nr:hypothetical protein [Thermococcus sp.]